MGSTVLGELEDIRFRGREKEGYGKKDLPRRHGEIPGREEQASCLRVAEQGHSSAVSLQGGCYGLVGFDLEDFAW